MRRTVITAAGLLATGLVATACSTSTSSNGASPAAATATGQPGSATNSPPPAAVKNLALTAADFPAPYVYRALPPGALEGAAGKVKGAVFDPPGCGASEVLPQGADPATTGVAIAVNSTTKALLVATVAPVSTSLAQLDSVVAQCAMFTVTVPAGPTARTSLTLLPPPQVNAEQSRALRTTSMVTSGGKTKNTSFLTLRAELKGVQVTVTGTPGTSGADVDPALLDELLIKAVQKVNAGS